MISICSKVDVVDYLLGQDADVGLLDDLGRSPLHHAASHGHRDIAVTLVSSGAPVNVIDCHGCTPLILAAANDTTGQ